MLIVGVFMVLVVLIAMVIGIGSAWAYAVFSGEQGQDLDPAMATWMALGVAAMIAIASGWKLLDLRGDGGRIAEALGAELVDPSTTNPFQKRYLNIVEEMAISARMPVPKAYVMKGESGINAFAAGATPERSAIAVTHGALAMLDRAELTGVVAHEMAHVANADTKLNGRLLAMVFGLVALTVVGRVIVRSAPRSRSSSNKGNATAFILMVGVLLVVVGALGALAARILQSMTSRQRELLADASAVQFTRDPDGLARALKKIGATYKGSKVGNAHAEEARHMFFAASTPMLAGLFATHPKLELRIRLLDPTFSPSTDEIWNDDEHGLMRRNRAELTGPWGSSP